MFVHTVMGKKVHFCTFKKKFRTVSSKNFNYDYTMKSIDQGNAMTF